jgi:hypothetical protein
MPMWLIELLVAAALVFGIIMTFRVIVARGADQPPFRGIAVEDALPGA